MKRFREYKLANDYLDQVNKETMDVIFRGKEPEVISQEDIDERYTKLQQERIEEDFKQSYLDENIQRRVRPQMEYISQTKRLLRELRNETGDDKIDVLGELIGLSIQIQLFGYR